MTDPVAYKYRKEMFAVCFVHLVLWAVTWMHAWHYRTRKTGVATHESLPTNNGVDNSANGLKHPNNRAAGAENAEQVARLTFILAIASTFAVSDLPFSNSRATAALLFVFMAVTVFHVITAIIFPRHRFFPLGFGIITFGIPIVLFGLAFRSTNEPYLGTQY
ncbi:hypothetical protein HKX48_008356 [Thoreauomyces humboldtii]|nr:hypothetical protein HKX48_008356 [Thoreauomyces humboldtii]